MLFNLKLTTTTGSDRKAHLKAIKSYEVNVSELELEKNKFPGKLLLFLFKNPAYESGNILN